MKRRDFILGSAGAALPLWVRAQAPCAPPQVSLAGGSSASTSCGLPGVAHYATSFPVAENPLSEGGKWLCGKAVGLDWNNPQVLPGRVCASVRSGASGSRYDDSIAHLSKAFATIGANQYAEGTVYRAAGYAPAGSKHEIELLLRFEISAHGARGYEVLWGHEGSFAIVRWNGPLGNYTDLGVNGPGPGVAADGDVLRAVISGNLIMVYKNGMLVGTSPPDSTWQDGQPGIGFWPVDSSTPSSYGWRRFEAGRP
jgi:hypothetical protein